jgi:hypothetical protein
VKVWLSCVEVWVSLFPAASNVCVKPIVPGVPPVWFHWVGYLPHLGSAHHNPTI